MLAFAPLILIVGTLQVVLCRKVVLMDGSIVVGSETCALEKKMVTQFLGIPYAEPPIGKLRFRKPLPKKPWRGQRLAMTMPNACMQASSRQFNADTRFGDFEGAKMWNPNVPMSEDCLYLNVVVPGYVNQTANLPVMVWIYGGGFATGCISLDVYNMKILASEENVIIVAMNYRMNIFGFLYMGNEGGPGNMGLWDQQLALKWVHENIKMFGGNPEHVTIFGESAGAVAVCMHLLSDKSSPYFQRAILESGSLLAPWAMHTPELALERFVQLLRLLPCQNLQNTTSLPDPETALKCLLTLPAETIVKLENSGVSEFLELAWIPFFDGDFFETDPVKALRKGKFSKETDLLLGTTANEAFYFLAYNLEEINPPEELFKRNDFVTTREAWIKSAKSLLPRNLYETEEALNAILSRYEPTKSPITPLDWLNSLDAMIGDLMFACGTIDTAIQNSLNKGRTFFYQFMHRSSVQTWPEWMGVLHGYEISFVLGEPLNTTAYNYTTEEQELSRRFMRYWANFAREGNPNQNSNGSVTETSWPIYCKDSRNYINLAPQSAHDEGLPRVGKGPKREKCEFWQHELPALLAITKSEPPSMEHQHLSLWQNAKQRGNNYTTEWLDQLYDYNNRIQKSHSIKS